MNTARRTFPGTLKMSTGTPDASVGAIGWARGPSALESVRGAPFRKRVGSPTHSGRNRKSSGRSFMKAEDYRRIFRLAPTQFTETRAG
jgi:hypothetical protein